jgi:hypothetical protein
VSENESKPRYEVVFSPCKSGADYILHERSTDGSKPIAAFYYEETAGRFAAMGNNFSQIKEIINEFHIAYILKSPGDLSAVELSKYIDRLRIVAQKISFDLKEGGKNE